ncbi:MAG TPA: metal-sensing transcriptional repressor [Gammaproteobacteria bacterium]|nr:metal-sensing transcriptional repressor [Gammaproteobacteria bacterium]
MTETIALHAEHPRIVQRLKRAEGHLKRVIAMIEEGRPCIDLAQQLQAVESAIVAAKRTLIRDHIDHCLEAAVGGEGRSVREALDEFKDITKYL